MANQTVHSAHSLEAVIDGAFESRATITPSTAEPALLDALDQVIAGLNAGSLRVAEKRDGTWVTNQWIKIPARTASRCGPRIIRWTMPISKAPSRKGEYGGGTVMLWDRGAGSRIPTRTRARRSRKGISTSRSKASG